MLVSGLYLGPHHLTTSWTLLFLALSSRLSSCLPDSFPTLTAALPSTHVFLPKWSSGGFLLGLVHYRVRKRSSEKR